MAKTTIEWCARPRADGTLAPGYTFNPWWGCEKVSLACKHCYAETFAKRVGQKVWGKDAPRRFFGDKHWAEPLAWDAEARAMAEQRFVFCASMADVFEDRSDLGSHRIRVFLLIESTPNLTWLLLTKRPENVRSMVPLRWLDAWPANAWLGATAENQDQLDRRAGPLLATPAPVHFLSCEPLLAPITRLWSRHVFDASNAPASARPCADVPTSFETTIDWVIVGGESGAGARPFNVAEARAIVEACRAAGIAPFVKQYGAHVVCPNDEVAEWLDQCAVALDDVDTRRVHMQGDLVRVRLRDRKGADPSEWESAMRVREFPREVR